MSANLVRYNAARRALAEVVRVDECKDIRDKAVAMLAYAKQARDTELIGYATEIRMRAERRAGEMLAGMAERGERATDKGGDRKSQSRGATVKLADLGVTKTQSSKWQNLARLLDGEFEKRIALHVRRAEQATTSAPGDTYQFSGEQEWYTPPEEIERARAAMGSIDVDPASNAVAQAYIRAREFFTIETDGLAHEWHGWAWLNPPYARGLIDKFIDKLLAEIAIGRVTQAILLTNNFSETSWFQAAARASTAMCFTNKRIEFLLRGTDEKASPRQGSTFFYFGPNVAAFKKAFADAGIIVRLA